MVPDLGQKRISSTQEPTPTPVLLGGREAVTTVVVVSRLPLCLRDTFLKKSFGLSFFYFQVSYLTFTFFGILKKLPGYQNVT